MLWILILQFTTLFIGCTSSGNELSLLLDKPGRCASVNVQCSHPNPSSRCFFHFECPGNQLCCSVDGCVSACTDPVSEAMEDNLVQGNESHLNNTGAFFSCKNGMKILSVYRCNGHKNCPGLDFSDELDCPCDPNQIQCSNGLCIGRDHLCKPEVSSEPTCSMQNFSCLAVDCPLKTHFRCRNEQCLPFSAKCDGKFDCLDGSDEEGCTCSTGNFVCDGGLCKSRLDVWCNGFPSCKDHSDEPGNCSCINGQFRCDNGRCIPEYEVCDMMDNCLDYSDERNCSISCTADNKLFECKNGEKCISLMQKCDNISDCSDNSDESDCGSSSHSERALPHTCERKGHFPCTGSGTCIPLSSWCDKIADCEERSDEPLNCTGFCPKYSFQCDGSRCFSEWFRCDGFEDCLDGSDEQSCGCSDNQMPLPNSGCLDASLFCNGISDVKDGLDEEQCTCTDRLKLDSSKICDGFQDCYDSSDELFCGNCTTSQYYCIRSKQCIFRNQTCDGQQDCSQGEDEEDCLAMVPQPCRIDSDMKVSQERAGCLAVKNRGDWMPVCAERWSNSLSDAICEIVGYDKSILTNLIMMDPSELNERSSDQKIPRSIDGPQIVISAAKTCPSRKKVFVECGSVNCGESPADMYQPHLINGVAVPDAKFPWTAGLYKNGKLFCGGTVINSDWILTSASCIMGMEDDHIVARLGPTRRNSFQRNEQYTSIDKIVIQPQYPMSRNSEILSADSDLALLHLEISLRWNDNVKPVCLPTSKYLPDEVVVTGWTRTIGRSKLFTEDSLLEAAIPTVNSSNCRKNPLVEGSISQNTFCGNLSGASRCIGDLGGAVMDKNYFGRWNIIGVTSFSMGCNGTNSVSGFTYVAPYLDWISNVTTGEFKKSTQRNIDCVGGARCSLGNCINPSQICDGNVDCQLASDEFNCSTPVPNAATNLMNGCNFGEITLCGFQQDLSDQLNWMRGGTTTSDEFPQPMVNHTSVKYAYISSRMNRAAPYSSARLFSAKLSMSTGARCLELVFIHRNAVLSVYDRMDSSQVLKTVFESINMTSWSIRRMEVPSMMTSFVIDGKLMPGNSSLIAIQSAALVEETCNIMVDRT